jgi:hypothetical protein
MMIESPLGIFHHRHRQNGIALSLSLSLSLCGSLSLISQLDRSINVSLLFALCSVATCTSNSDCVSISDVIASSYCDFTTSTCRLVARRPSPAATPTPVPPPPPPQQNNAQAATEATDNVAAAAEVQAYTTQAYTPAPLVNPIVTTDDWIVAAFGWAVLAVVLLSILACMLWYVVAMFRNRATDDE